MKENGSVIKISPSMLIPNKKKQEVYQGKPQNYEEIKKNIEEHGIIEPLLVNKKTNVIISGNLRLQIVDTSAPLGGKSCVSEHHTPVLREQSVIN